VQGWIPFFPGSHAWIPIGFGSHVCCFIVTMHLFFFLALSFVIFFEFYIVFQTQIGKFTNVEFEGGC
jgi:hypothetical protein